MSQFKGLPMEELIAGPLSAAAKAQTQLAGVTADFINNIGLEGPDGNKQARTVDFTYDRPVTKQDGSISQEQSKLTVPLLSIVNVPNLSIQEASVDFNMEVKSSSLDTSETSKAASVSASYKSFFSPFKASFTASVSSKDTSTRSSDTSAKYSVSVKAADRGMPEGLSRVLDMLNSSIQPTAASGSSGSKDPKDATIDES